MPLPRRSLAALAALLLALSALAGCGPMGPSPSRRAGPRTLDAAPSPATGPGLTVRVEMFNGPIEVRAGAAGRVYGHR